MIGLHELIKIGKSIMLRGTGGMQILAGKLSIDQILLANHLLAPKDDIVHVRGGDTSQFGNASCDDQPHGNVFGKVPVLEVGQILGLPIDLHLSHGMGQAAISLVGTEHGVDAGLVANVVAVAGEHPLADVVQTVEVEGRIALEEDPLELHDLVGYQIELLAGVFVGSLVKEGRSIEGFGNIAVAVEAITDRRVPHTVDIHQCDCQEVAGGIKDGKFAYQTVEDVRDVLFRLAMLGRDNDLDLLLGSKNLNGLAILDNTAGPGQCFEGKQVGMADELAAEVVDGTQVKTTLAGHGADGNALLQIRLELLQVHLVDEAGQSEDDNVEIGRNFLGLVGHNVRFAVDVVAEVVDALYALGGNCGGKSVGLAGE